MAKYNIQRWDPVIHGNNVAPFPIIYVKPDSSLYNLVNKNIAVRIDGTNTIYDGKTLVGMVNSSALQPTCMPNYYNKTGLFTISLYAQWYEYPQPDSLGVVTILDPSSPLQEETCMEREEYDNSPIDDIPTTTCRTCGMSNGAIFGILGGIFVVFVVLVWISMKKK